MPAPTIKTTTLRTVKEEHELTLTNEELIVILQDKGYKIPQACEVFVTVPGGGDWSNTDLSVDARNPLRVTWITYTESKDDGQKTD